MDNLGLMDRFSDPKLYEQLTVGEKISGAMITTLMGMGITFAVLILLWGVIALMTKMLTQQQSAPKPAVSTASTQVVSAVSQAPVAAPVTGSQEMNPELIAVIMAAIAAGEGKEFANRLVIRKINRASGDIPAWGMAGAKDAIDSRRL